MSMLPSNAPEWERARPAPGKSAPRVNGGLVITAVVALVLVAIIALAVTRMSGASFPRPIAAATPAPPAAAQAAAQAAAAGTPADGPTQQAIQQVIQDLDAAQAQAIQTNNPSLMSATATPAFYQEQVATNQDLVDNGVTEVKLVNIEWGAITINGNTATATCYETWSTTFDDGSTEQSRDRNVYTLVLDNGNWKVQADDHPDQSAAGVPNPQQPNQP
ncbi:MAG TPA: hypothetical protein VF937_05120 [Chloroflexota bacterium]